MSNNMFLVFRVLLLAAACAAIAGMRSPISAAAAAAPAAKDAQNPFADKEDAVKQGGKLFDEKCSECHGDGTGMTGPDLTDDTWIYGSTDAKVFETIQDGRKGGMPSWRTDITREDTWKIITYIRSLKKK